MGKQQGTMVFSRVIPAADMADGGGAICIESNTRPGIFNLGIMVNSYHVDVLSTPCSAMGYTEQLTYANTDTAAAHRAAASGKYNLTVHQLLGKRHNMSIYEK